MFTTAKIDVKEIVDFVLTHTSYYKEVEREELERYCQDHINFKTIYVLRDDQGIAAVCRWNALASLDTLHVIDMIIRPDLRRIKTLKFIAMQILNRNLNVRYFYYERYKHAERKSYGYELRHWLHLKENSRHVRKI